MSTLKIGLPCIHVEENAFARNLKTVEELLEERAEEDIDLFVFGEATLTGLDTTNFNARDVSDTSHVVQLIGNLSSRCLVRQLKRFGAEPLHADHRDEGVG